MEQFVITHPPVDTYLLANPSYRQNVRDWLDYGVGDKIKEVLQDGHHHVFKVSYGEEPHKMGDLDETVCYAQIEMMAVRYQSYAITLPDYETMPTYRVARDAIGELKFRIRSRWRKLWSRKW